MRHPRGRVRAAPPDSGTASSPRCTAHSLTPRCPDPGRRRTLTGSARRLSQVGTGRRDYDAACGAVRDWRHFDLGWASVAGRPPVRVGSPVVVQARTLQLWTLNPLRITSASERPAQAHKGEAAGGRRGSAALLHEVGNLNGLWIAEHRRCSYARPPPPPPPMLLQGDGMHLHTPRLLATRLVERSDLQSTGTAGTTRCGAQRRCAELPGHAAASGGRRLRPARPARARSWAAGALAAGSIPGGAVNGAGAPPASHLLPP